MSKNKFTTIVIVLFLAVVALFTIVKYAINGNGSLISPTASLSTPPPQVSSNNPPKEIQYSSATDLKKELETVNPQLMDEDFE